MKAFAVDVLDYTLLTTAQLRDKNDRETLDFGRWSKRRVAADRCSSFIPSFYLFRTGHTFIAGQRWDRLGIHDARASSVSTSAAAST